MIPFLIAVVPVAIVYGFAVTESIVDNIIGLSGSWIVLGGASQLSIIDSIDSNASAGLTIATATMINLRFALYSAALAPTYARYPLIQRVWLTYTLTDQGAALVMAHDETDPDDRAGLAYALVACTAITSTWWVATILGAALGATIPDNIDMAFAMPLMFIVLAIPTLKDRPSLVAGLVGAGVALAAKDLPQGANIVIGGLAGIMAGRAVQIHTDSGADPTRSRR
ncbi:MAG: hypothetical protein GY708_08345 [Actinomycetia bacterium]|nr:hypothetical protein [Actinomycetes bacterium]MCP4958698.1 hypothetical protein [Actinomycetes bacterium]